MRPHMENLSAFVVGTLFAWMLVESIAQAVAR